ncbi:phospholipase D family protein [Methanobrevibacter ruminantium]|uniref:phospholipase D family protein n=1 Tax=Methanobrevibacter ruminantium TaxID=83816 RepID=UPI002D7F2182|nr:phospholipase D family protein [Methanobrevibacter ruminantium]
MLNPNNNRLDYGEILSPPNNYELDFAIGTTYSLDLDALVGAAISLGLSEETDTNLRNNPIFLLEALRTTGDKIILFCEGGQIHLPNKPNPLYILLEEIVFQVNSSTRFENKRYSSFHPKFWLLRYTNEENNVLYKVVVLSRNLTFDRSWDISFAMDGFLRDERTDKNNPIADFLKYLNDYSKNDEKSSKIEDIINELSYVHFDLNSRDFFDFEFIPNGIADYTIRNSNLFKDFDELLIMSPFLSKTLIREFNEHIRNKSKAFLFTRENSLNGLNYEDCGNFEIFTLKDQIIDGESSFSEELDESSNGEIIKQDIHAKMFMVSHEDITDLYLGSLNATHNALYGNIEFMVKLRAKRNKLNLKLLSEGLFDGEEGGPNSPFQLVDINNFADEKKVAANNDLNLIIKTINRLDPKACIKFKENSYNIWLCFNDFKEEHISKFKDFEIEIRPLLSNKKFMFERKICFKNIDKIRLSEFFVLSVKNLNEEGSEIIERVIKVHTTGLPEDREKEVISSVVNDKEAFIRYVAFLLGDKYILSVMEAESGFGSNTSNFAFRVQLPELYEKMLKASVYSPEKFEELEFLIKTLSDDDVIPEGFEELYNTFKQVVD